MRNIRFYDYIPLAANTLYWQFLIKSGRYGNKVHRQVNISGDTVTTEFQGREIVFVLQSETQQEILNAIDVTYHQKLYGNIDVKDKIVIDIGANIGDTAIYFALMGAKMVYAFEPFPYLYDLAKRNVEINNLQDKITVVKAGYGSGKMMLDANPSGQNREAKGGAKGEEVEFFNLGQILDRFSIGSAVLKMDCEGAEYNLLKENEAIFDRIDAACIEYHYGYVNLCNMLAKHYKVSHTSPTMANNEDHTKILHMGIITCKKG